MLEKIGLPPKPSLRGNNWVADASHCQGCSSQFTFINRKHHCRRCGGLFCNNCTQQRMVLRGQGDSPVRICEPCKKLEEAARFEMRYGHKNRSVRGSSKLPSKYEEEILNQILGNEGKGFVSAARSSSMNMLSGTNQTTSDASCSNMEEISAKDGRDNVLRSASFDQQHVSDIGNTTPDELRQQAIEEKKKYKTLKAEGKPEDAMKAFKRGKELERQAGALELYLRKNRKKTLASAKDESGAIGGRTKITPQKIEGKDDLASELKELGWSDMDLRESEKRPATLSLESELSTILGDVIQKPNIAKRTHGPDKSQVIAHKKKALEFKRAGNLADAKEELKKAKVLEKQIEEQELLGDSEDSDDELSSLLRSIDDVKDDASTVGFNPNSAFDFDNLLGAADNLDVDASFDVTEDDMDDPEIAAALTSLGWTEDTSDSADTKSHSAFSVKEALMDEIHSLKSAALSQKRAGNTVEALSLLKKAKLLEKDLDSSDSKNHLTGHSSVMVQKVSTSQLVDSVSDVGAMTEIVDETKDEGRKMGAKSKLMIQKELLGLKKRALALRREGKVDEAEEELKKGKVLEKQLEEMGKAPKAMQLNPQKKLASNTAVTDIGDEDDVTDQDMHDPSYLSLLENLGWKDDDNQKLQSTAQEAESFTVASNYSVIPATANISTGKLRKSKGEIQRELLGLKRKALALRRRGEVEEAEEVLNMASTLEAQLEEIETPLKNEVPAGQRSDMEGDVNAGAQPKTDNLTVNSDAEIRPMDDIGCRDEIRPENVKETAVSVDSCGPASNFTPAAISLNDPSSLQQEILAHKRKAVLLKREGKLAEAKEELRQAKLLEKHVDENSHSSPSSSPDVVGPKASAAGKKEDSPNLGQKPLTGRERFKLQQESLSHKRQALKLRREGRTEEADAELELAKALEARLEDSATHDSTTEKIDDVSVESFLDADLLSALKAIGIQDTSAGSQRPQDPVSVSKNPVVSKVDSSPEDRVQLEERIKAEKLKAVQLKRSGKQAEAMDALRRAKLYEKRLNALAS